MDFVPVGPVPVQRKCPSCGVSIITRIEHKPSTKTHLISAILFVSLCFLCAFLPYYTNTCKNVNHYCPQCNAYLGTYKN